MEAKHIYYCKILKSKHAYVHNVSRCLDETTHLMVLSHEQMHAPTMQTAWAETTLQEIDRKAVIVRASVITALIGAIWIVILEEFTTQKTDNTNAR